MGQSTNTSPGGSPADSVTGETVERERTESLRNASLHRKMLETHLHVPSIRHVSGSRSGFVRRMGAGSTSTPGMLISSGSRSGLADVVQTCHYPETVHSRSDLPRHHLSHPRNPSPIPEHPRDLPVHPWPRLTSLTKVEPIRRPVSYLVYGSNQPRPTDDGVKSNNA